MENINLEKLKNRRSELDYNDIEKTITGKVAGISSIQKSNVINSNTRRSSLRNSKESTRQKNTKEDLFCDLTWSYQNGIQGSLELKFIKQIERRTSKKKRNRK